MPYIKCVKAEIDLQQDWYEVVYEDKEDDHLLVVDNDGTFIDIVWDQVYEVFDQTTPD